MFDEIYGRSSVPTLAIDRHDCPSTGAIVHDLFTNREI
jgi:hypothetical protein